MIFFSSNNKKIERIDKNREEVTKNRSCKLQFIIDRTKFMASSLQNLINNLAEKIHKI